MSTGRTGTLRVALTAQGATDSRFHVVIDGRLFNLSGPNISAQTAVVASGETLVYVGWRLSYYDDDFVPGPVSFSITTSLDDE